MRRSGRLKELSDREQITQRGLNHEPTKARKSLSEIAPHLAELTDKVLFGDVCEHSALPPRDRSLMTITSLIRCIA